MGVAGSITLKADISPLLSVFTSWKQAEMKSLFDRNRAMLTDTFALRFHEFYFLLDRDLVGFVNARGLFDKIFDVNSRQLVDKYEVLCVITMASSLSAKEKIDYIFEAFNFNNKGYLTRSETSLMIRSVVSGIYKADPSIGLPSNELFEEYVSTAFTFATQNSNSLRKPEIAKFSIDIRECREFMESWRGVAV